MTQLRGEELLRFTQVCKRVPKEQRLSAYEILARSGYEGRKEKEIDSFSIKTHAVERFMNNYCKALIDKYGVPERLEQPLGPHPNARFAEEATLPEELLEAVQQLKVSMKAFKAGYISWKNEKVNINHAEYKKACERAKKERREKARNEAQERRAELKARAQEAIKNELDMRSKEYRERGAKALGRVSAPQPSPKAIDIERQVLTGKELILHCIRLANQGVTETSICIRAGYKTESIGVFRRAFSKSATVRFGPLSAMLRDLSKTHENAPKILAEMDATRNINFEKKTEALANTNTNQAITKERNLISITSIERERDSNFRNSILKSHGEQCACCDIKIRELLEAAHIIPIALNGSDITANGLPLCPTHHSAFDRHLFTFDPTDKTIKLKEGVTALDLGITRKTLDLDVSQEALRRRLNLFTGASFS